MALGQQQNDNYQTLWKQVEKLEGDALTKSALKLVTEIAEMAKKEKNPAQLVKALLYSSKYAMTLEEDAQLAIINDFKDAIAKSEAPTKNVLESYLGGLFWQYFQQNRYQFYNRTKTETKVDSTDFRTWDLTTLFKEVGMHYDASLENEVLLQQTPVSDFDVILHQQSDTEEYRPTLFDLLAHNALEFYRSSENNITRPADKFELKNPDLLCSGDAFVSKKISGHDPTSLQAKALRIYQKLLKLHANSTKPYTYAEVNIERLNFIYQHATFENKTEQFIEVLTNASSATKGKPASGLYEYQIANLAFQEGNTYQAKTGEENRWKIKQALDICENVISELPNTRGAVQCKALKSQILQKSLHLTTEQHIPINTTARFLVSYKNLDGLTLTARRISQRQQVALNKLYEEDKILAYIKKLKVTKEWQAVLRDENDYQSHTTEISMPAISNGHYLVLAETKEVATRVFAFSILQVTDMALSETRTDTHHNFQVLNRHNGKPIADAKLSLRYRKNYDGPRLSKSFNTNKMGTVSIPLSEDNWSDVDITISKSGDSAFYSNFYINRRYNRNKEGTTNSCFLFTDRSIYRPGQPLYFKGIALKKTNGISSILEKRKVTVKLYDVNGQEVASEKFITNNFGSFSGEFVLPNNGLTGQYSMRVSSEGINLNGYASFSVEEYKRPKFETSFEPVTSSYKVNDSVTVKGIARAYAGSMITDAKVVYRVKRMVYYPRWYYWSYRYYNSTPQEIAFGETITDASGAYEIDFKALPDTSTDKKNMPTFSYEVTADVTDINGETHSTSTVVTVGYHSMTANMTLANSFNKDAKENILSIATNNLNGQDVPAQGTVKMYKLQAPESVNRPRTWEAPTYPGWTKEKFKELYPHDAFSNEHDTATWKKGELVWEKKFDTEKSKKISFGNTKKWKSGTYVLELETKDKFGQPVKDILQTTVFSHNDKKLADNQLFKIKTDKDSYEIGDKAKVSLFSSAEDLHVTVYIEKDHKVVDSKLIHLSGDSKSFTVPVTKDDLGGFAITYSFSVYNHFQAGSILIVVPYPSSQLEIETLTFRDKLQPGTDETWSFKIKGPQGDKVSAELLANMYDASLDAFKSHYWGFNPLIRPGYYTNRLANAHASFGTSSFNTYLNNSSYGYDGLQFDSFNWFGLYFGRGGYYGNSVAKLMNGRVAGVEVAEMSMMADDAELDEVIVTAKGVAKEKKALGYAVVKAEADKPRPEQQEVNKDEQGGESDIVQIRKNLQENAFFFPQLLTDKEGNVSFNFTTPEALTKWNVQLLAHTTDLKSTYQSLQTVTQKELMVLPNAPRFLREGDEIFISSKIANLTEKALSGQAKLELIDAITGQDISKKIVQNSRIKGAMLQAEGDVEVSKKFQVDSMGNTQVSWRLKIPNGVQAVQYIISAKAGSFGDAEQNVLPVLSNRMLVTETLPMWVRSKESKTFTLDKLKTNSSSSLTHHKLSLEITSNPAWYAVQALPYLMEYPYECNEQTFSKYYANSLASYIANSNPRIQEVFKQWANSDALLSNLEKNQELKSLLIQETPWLRDAQSETAQKKRIALLFNLNKMKSEQATALNKLKQNQKSSGAWPWFNGGPDNRFITQHIITGLGHLKKLSVTSSGVEMQRVIQKAIAYLDQAFVREYNQMKKHASNINDDHLSRTQLHYLYMRSFFKELKSSKKVKEISAYYMGQMQKYWKNRDLYSKGMMALILHREQDAKTAAKILRALEENSISSEELGMYWKENTNSWYWYQAPIETQSLLIETFSEITPSATKTIDNLKIWLLKNKQTNQWKTTKATSDAVYALLLQGTNWLSVTDAVEVLVGGKKIEAAKLENVKVEAGTGYYKTTWNGAEVTPEMAEIQISKKDEGIAWGALYWQYFEDLDKITTSKTPLQLKKKLFLKKNTATGEEISEIVESTNLKVGDLVRVRIELRADRAMEFVHMKDMRAAGFEPINVISRYKWQDGLGYYESTKDASTNFFFDYLPKGVYVFEYDLRVNNAGDFSNGITTIQSMYAPEFSSHSEGIRVKVN